MRNLPDYILEGDSCPPLGCSDIPFRLLRPENQLRRCRRYLIWLLRQRGPQPVPEPAPWDDPDW